jgi:hypothetical protein
LNTLTLYPAWTRNAASIELGQRAQPCCLAWLDTLSSSICANLILKSPLKFEWTVFQTKKTEQSISEIQQAYG